MTVIEVTFEQEVRKLLDKHFPCSALSNIPIYRPAGAEDRLRGYEIDHLLHVSSELNDRLIIVECKEGRVFGENSGRDADNTGPWNYQYHGAPKPKDIKGAQLRNHSRALRAYLQDRVKPLFVEAWLVSQSATPIREDKRGRHIHYKLMGVPTFCSELVRIRNEETVLRVEQSALLGELRKGVPVRDMGHPELNNALAYVERCRRSIDMELFLAFAPKPNIWAINGTAGMGKSVLLAYALFVFASNRRVAVDTTAQDDEKFLIDFEKDANEIGLPEYGKRAIYVVARKEKQLRAIEYFWDRFVKEYALLEDGLSLRFQKPVFRRWSRDFLNNEECNVLLIDESHDLDADDQVAVRDWVNVDPQNRYLAIACDRHQKLRLVGADAVLIEGLNFSLHTDKLKRNYRNPFSIYTAGLALMFRWCAPSGPKVIPTEAQLKNEFGFEVPQYSTEPGGNVLLQNWNDSHPANHWSFTISTFLTCEDAFAQLDNSGVAGEKVLWVRFRSEEDSFDYEKLLRFTYHNCHTIESFEFVDKYVKGQEFPVVVVEGFPPEADLSEFEGIPGTREQAMWSARRELYLCCSRATTFLYFVVPRDDAESGISHEIRDIVKKVSEPTNPQDVTRRTWQIDFVRTDITRKVDEFHFQESAAAAVADGDATPSEITIERPVTVRRLYEQLKVKPEAIISDLFSLGCTFRLSSDVVPDDIAKEVALRQGVILHVAGADSSPPPTAAPQAIPPAPPVPPAAIPTPDQRQTAPMLKDYDAELNRFLDSPRFPWHANAVRKYLSLLQWVVDSFPPGRALLVTYRREGASRRYFAESDSEIYEHASSPNPHRIGNTGLWALTTMDNRSKREVLDDVLRACDISLDVRQKAIASIK